MDVEVADGLLKEASLKLEDALSSTPLNKTKCYSCQNDAGCCKGKMSGGEMAKIPSFRGLRVDF